MRTSSAVRSVCAGTAGTAAMTLAYSAERRLRRGVSGALDYDDSLVPGQIVASVMHLPHVTARGDQDLGLLLRWSYGSAFGLWHGALHRMVREPWARRLRRHAHDRDIDAVPAARPHPAALAVAGRRDCHQRRDACRLRLGGRGRGRRTPPADEMNPGSPVIRSR